MHELVPLFGAMIVAIVVMIGLVRIMRGWMAQRDEILSDRG